MNQLAWIVAHLDDVESDLSVFHRVDDMWSMPAGRFVRLVERLWHYPGAVRDRALMQQAATEPAPQRASAPPADPPGAQVVDGAREVLSHHEAFADLIEWG